jgi:hypothetical protein
MTIMINGDIVSHVVIGNNEVVSEFCSDLDKHDPDNKFTISEALWQNES